MLRVSARALSVFCPHCQKRLSLESFTIVGAHPGKLLMTCGDILVAQTARLHLDIYAGSVVIHGKVRGTVHGSESVEVGPTGRVSGDIRAPRIIVHEGALIEGRCEMTRPAGSHQAVAEPPSQDSVVAEPEPAPPDHWSNVRPLPPPRNSTPPS